MKRYTKVEENLFRLLCSQDVEGIDCVGNVIQSSVFKSGTSALLVNRNEKTVKLFYAISNDRNKDRKEFASLVSLMSLMEEAEINGLIYLQPIKLDSEWFFYENYKGFLHGCDEGVEVMRSISQREKIVYDIRNANTSQSQSKSGAITNSNVLYIEKDKSRIMRSADVSDLYERVEQYLCRRAYPTSKLFRFIDNGFCLDEEKRSVTSLRYSKASLFISIAAFIISTPFVSVWYSNKYAYSTVDTIQYRQLLQKVDTVISFERELQNGMVSPKACNKAEKRR